MDIVNDFKEEREEKEMLLVFQKIGYWLSEFLYYMLQCIIKNIIKNIINNFINIKNRFIYKKYSLLESCF